ncbi:unnamed protein product [Parnassius apollo]|uniref:(apollo) hypothetical protein n=1 Tax=Parnassius apollo TaxID=110799 RepID=A0A8S3XB04_PARAO|nr:unnamed protein product [Parnassius apollo]
MPTARSENWESRQSGGLEACGAPAHQQSTTPRMATKEESMETEVIKEEKVVKKQTNTGKVTEEQNGDTNVEAAVTVKLPGKKTSAKTETKVEVVKKELPDGSVEEVKTTTTRTTIDGKTEITTKTETTIIPKEDDLEEEEIVEEEEEEEEEELENNGNELVQKGLEGNVELHEEEQKINKEPIQNIIKQKETSETSITENVTVIKSTESQNDSEEEIEEEGEEEEEEVEENENVEVTVTQKEVEPILQKKTDIDDKIKSEAGDEDEEETSDKDEEVCLTTQENNIMKSQTCGKEKVEEVREIDKVNDICESEEENEKLPLQDNISKDISLEEKEKEEVSEEKDDIIKEKLIRESDPANINEQTNASNNETVKEATSPTQENKEETVIEVQILKPELSTKEETKPEVSSDLKDKEDKPTLPTDRNIPLREPSVPLEKVEEVEIKPIGQIVSKSHTENTEIITTSIDKPTTGLSTQTEYNRIENIVTVNRTTKTLDQAYEQISQHGVPTVKTYFAPNDRPLISPQSTRSHQSPYPSEPQGERRHSLLLDRLSVDRQIPPTELYQSNYQYGNQTYEQNISSQEPQSEVLTVSNVKPSSITKNQQWYQETKKDEVTYNNTAPSLNVPSQQWNLKQSHPQSQPRPQSQPQLESAYQSSLQLQSPYAQNTQDTYRTNLNTLSSYQQHSYPSYTQKPMRATPSINKQSNQFSYIEKATPESYQRPSQQFSSTYIPPPWEQDPNYVADNINHTLYSPQTSNTFTNSANQTWTPPTASTFSKPKPTSYIPPAPNQSFVKPVTTVDPPKMPGRKTYYSEYERRYISVPETTYIPTENKFQAQPNPSPQYYYDNYEPAETVEHEWRKELREFSEKTQTQSQSEKTLVKPPWEEDPKYYVPKVTTEYTPTPTWSQTLRPNSGRERSFESEFVRSQELPKTNTLGRGRPQSSYVKSNVSTPILERPRGVSVDRYNPNNYKSPTPSEYPPVQSHTLDPSIGPKTYHNPNVPVYHARASAEPREQVFPQTRQWGEARASPIQSRSFKYLQWITGTED